jgi:hypothetical protein
MAEENSTSLFCATPTTLATTALYSQSSHYKKPYQLQKVMVNFIRTSDTMIYPAMGTVHGTHTVNNSLRIRYQTYHDIMR